VFELSGKFVCIDIFLLTLWTWN